MSIGSRKRRFWAQLRGPLRAALLLVLTLAVSGLFFLRSAKARAAEQLALFGRELLRWQGAEFHGDPRRLSVNGIEFRLVTASTPLPVDRALERLRAICQERGGLAEAVGGLSARSPATQPPAGGVLSWQSETEGIVACLDTGHPLGLDELVERARQFGVTGDLAAIGELRYVLARRSGTTTTLLVLWTEGSAKLRKAFPATGDVPGSDPPDVPRPMRARRLLAAAERGQPYSMTSYSVEGTPPAELGSWYERELHRAGWTVKRSARGLMARQGERRIVVRITAGRSGAVASIVGLS